jgi:DNA-directed RNA polymerase specialized sigma24 family protein
VAEENHIPWPHIETSYTDEFGHVEIDVHRVAGDIWPWAERYARQVLQDGQAGQRLLLQATAIVSRVNAEHAEHISDLRAYLVRTFKRLVLAQLEKESGHRRLESEMLRGSVDEGNASTPDLEQKILVQQIVQRMDGWMREIFEQLVLGHTFEEIGRKSRQNAHSLRTKYNKHFNKLIKQMRAEMLPAAESPRTKAPVKPTSSSHHQKTPGR